MHTIFLPLIYSNFSDIFITFLAPLPYALISPPVPNKVPPKYLVTIINTSVNFAYLITSSIGYPAVFEGSPSSLNLSIFPNYICIAIMCSIIIFLIIHFNNIF